MNKHCLMKNKKKIAPRLWGEYHGVRFDFDQTERGFIQAAIQSSVTFTFRDGDCAYLMPGYDLIRVQYSEWLNKYIAGHVVSCEPLRVMLTRKVR